LEPHKDGLGVFGKKKRLRGELGRLRELKKREIAGRQKTYAEYGKEFSRPLAVKNASDDLPSWRREKCHTNERR